jgi:hypothetical protein
VPSIQIPMGTKYPNGGVEETSTKDDSNHILWENPDPVVFSFTSESDYSISAMEKTAKEWSSRAWGTPAKGLKRMFFLGPPPRQFRKDWKREVWQYRNSQGRFVDEGDLQILWQILSMETVNVLTETAMFALGLRDLLEIA